MDDSQPRDFYPRDILLCGGFGWIVLIVSFSIAINRAPGDSVYDDHQFFFDYVFWFAFWLSVGSLFYLDAQTETDNRKALRIAFILSNLGIVSIQGFMFVVGYMF